MAFLACETVETSQVITASVIWLHGLGANGHDFVPVVPMLKLPDDLGIRFIFPHAPSIPVTINGGMVMPAWYDILAIDMERKIDNDQIRQSANKVINLVEREIERGIDSHRIILAGFSQGGAVCYEAALSYGKPLGGLMALSTYFATYNTVEINAENQSLPIHIYHGEHDQVVPEQMGLDAMKHLKALGYTPAFSHYPIAHEVSYDEIIDLGRWIRDRLA